MYSAISKPYRRDAIIICRNWQQNIPLNHRWYVYDVCDVRLLVRRPRSYIHSIESIKCCEWTKTIVKTEGNWGKWKNRKISKLTTNGWADGRTGDWMNNQTIRKSWFWAKFGWSFHVQNACLFCLSFAMPMLKSTMCCCAWTVNTTKKKQQNQKQQHETQAKTKPKTWYTFSNHANSVSTC